MFDSSNLSDIANGCCIFLLASWFNVSLTVIANHRAFMFIFSPDMPSLFAAYFTIIKVQATLSKVQIESWEIRAGLLLCVMLNSLDTDVPVV